MPKSTDEAKERKRGLIAEVNADRQLKEQDLGWLFRPLAVCPFPAYSMGKRKVINANGKIAHEYEILWKRRAGAIKVEILGHPEFGVPHGQDTLIILYLAYEARRQGARKIKVNFYRDFMKVFEMNPNDGRKYRLVVESLRRIRNASFSWEVEGEYGRERGLHFIYIDEYDLLCDPKNPEQPPLWDQYITLSERFWDEIRKHRIPSNLKGIIALKSRPAHLNFYIWLSYRIGAVFQETIAKGKEPKTFLIPFWGEQGLQEQMSSVIERKNDFRIQVKRWMQSVREIWPNCPVEIEGDALRICVTKEEQLDVLPMATDAPRILPKPGEIPEKPQNVCPACGSLRTLKPGKQSRKGYRMPDFWLCAGGCKPVSAEAVCPECARVMAEKNKGRADYYYQCECGVVKAGEAFWSENSTNGIN